jgi:hypothetical protein
VKGIGHESKRVGKETRDDLDEEKDSVDSDHDLDPGTLGPSHLLKNTHDEVDGLETEQKMKRKKWFVLMKMENEEEKKSWRGLRWIMG